MKYYPCGGCTLERDRCCREGQTNCKAYREWLREKREANESEGISEADRNPGQKD